MNQFKKIVKSFIIIMFFLIEAYNGLVNSPPKIIKQPKENFFEVTNNKNEIEKPFFMECEAVGNPTPSYRWTKNGRDVPTNNNGHVIQEFGTIFIANPKEDDMGYYQCFAENKFGIAMSDSVFVGKAFLNPFNENNVRSVIAEEGKPYRLRCQQPNGYPKLEVHWLLGIDYKTSINNTRMTVDPEGNLWFSYVTYDDGNFFYTCLVKSPVLNEFKMGIPIKLTVSPRIVTKKHVVDGLTKLYTTKKNEIVVQGRNIELFCIFGGTAIHEIEWFKNGQTLYSNGKDNNPNDDQDNNSNNDDNDDDEEGDDDKINNNIIRNDGRIEIRNYGKSVLIKKTTIDDGGVYTCELSDRFSNVTSFTINLKVLAIPSFTIEPEDKNVTIEDELVTIKCEAVGNPDPVIQWFFNGKPIEKAPNNARRLVSNNIIQIHHIMENDIGNYGCNASNNLGYIYKDVYLNVLAFAPEIIKKQKLSTIVESLVNITCMVSGMPKPIIKWYRNSEELIGYRYIKSQYNLLQIINVTYNDAGNYSCIAKNKYGQIENIIPLSVKNKTQIIQFKNEYKTVAGEPITLACNAIADHSLNLTIEWQINSIKFDFDESYRLSILNDNSLSISETIVADSKIYTCVARTELDEVSLITELLVQDVPNAPELTGIQCYTHDATISWSSQGDNNSPILYYTIEYNTTFTKNMWNIAVENISAIDSSYTVAMSPWANYTFRVIAHNEIGSSMSSSHSDVCSTQPAVPSKNPDNVEGKGTQPHNLVISWTAMPEIDQNGPGFHYKISYKRDKIFEQFHVKEIYDWTQTSLTIRDQPIFQKYNIRVIAVNNLGESNVATREIFGYSGEDVPLKAPENLCLVQLTGINSAIIQWDLVLNTTVRGHLKGYKIESWSTDEGELGIREFYVDHNSNTAELKHLKSNTINFVQVFVYNEKYYGPGSKIIKFVTPEGVPSIVQSFKAVPIGGTGFKLNWREPWETNGNLTGYKIYYQMIKGNKLGAKLELNPQITNPTIKETTINGLKPDQKYRLFIRATTKAGEGSVFFIDRMTEAIPEFIPDIPIFSLERSRNEFNYATIKIKWLNILAPKSGAYFYIKYKKTNQEIWNKSDRVYIYDEITIDSLHPFSKYDVRIYAVNGQLESKSIIQQIDLSLISEPRLKHYTQHEINYDPIPRGMHLQLYLHNQDAMCSPL